MKTLISFLVISMTLSACQKKQFFASGPEIDIAKKVDALYHSRDWEGLRAMYADTAKIVVNEWSMTGMPVNDFIESLKASVSDYTSTRQGNSYYEAVIDDNGEVFTHSWQEWIGQHKSGNEINVLVNITLHIKNEKVVWSGFVYDTHKLVMAGELTDSTLMK